jgi:hypothetical protein
MPSLRPEEVQKLVNTNTYPIFVETGTYHGETCVAMTPFFSKIHTIEIDPRLVSRAKTLFGNKNIEFHLGDSVEVFKTLLPSLDKNTVFWLDGHWSSGYNAGKGSVDCPLLEELNLIMEKFSPECLVLIDDCRLFGTHKAEDWSNITSDAIFKIVGPRLLKHTWIPSVLHPKDRLCLWIKTL